MYMKTRLWATQVPALEPVRMPRGLLQNKDTDFEEPNRSKNKQTYP